MLFWVGITDDDWFIHLSRMHPQPDEVNFWQPGPTPPRKMDPGTLFLFKLHAPHHVVVGGGHFVRFTVLPCFLAWEAFGEKNGVTSLQELIRRMTYYRHSANSSCRAMLLYCRALRNFKKRLDGAKGVYL